MSGATATDIRKLRALHPAQRVAYAAPIMTVLIVLLPLAVLLFIALTSSSSEVTSLLSSVLPRAALVTAELLFLVAVLTGGVGVVTAWLVVEFDFPLRRFLSWALVLPVAIPTYIAAYAFVEFFNFAGPVQGLIRSIFGFETVRDYWFPNIRSMGGAALIMSLVLYPYVYLAARVVFLMQGRQQADVARSLGASPQRVFWKVLLPMARPAIAAGVSLALMEALNDLGAVEYLGVRTLTFSIYNTWLAQGSLGGAAQLACAMLIVVFVLLRVERNARRSQSFQGGRHLGMQTAPRGVRLNGWRAVLASTACLAPVAFGFGIPAYVIGTFALKRLDQVAEPALHSALFNSILVGLTTATLTVFTALMLINSVRVLKSRFARALVRFASIGYAVPGTALALGLLFALAGFDNWFDSVMRAQFGISTGLLLTGSMAGIVLACSIRFLTLGEGTIQAGFEKLPANLDGAARNLGQTAAGAARTVLLPLLSPSILTAAVLIFVDTLKELPATILLRPIGFNTLATFVYENASRAAVEDAAVAALLIVLAGLAPVIFLSRTLLLPTHTRGKKMAPAETGASKAV
jgi:iron(III) transport system permease protein